MTVYLAVVFAFVFDTTFFVVTVDWLGLWASPTTLTVPTASKPITKVMLVNKINVDLRCMLRPHSWLVLSGSDLIVSGNSQY